VVRQRIAEFCETESPFETGEIEIDESYFGARRVRGVRGRGAHGKHIVFGLIKRGGKVYTQVVRNCSATELLPIIREKVSEESIVYTDGFKTYDGLVDLGYKKHHRIKHVQNKFAHGTNHINGIYFYLYLKEYEFRFNNRNQNIEKLLLRIIKN